MEKQAAIYSSSMIECGDDKEVVNTVLGASLCAKLKRWNLAIRNWIYPAHLEGLWLTSGIVTALYFGNRTIPYDMINRIVEQFPNSTTESKVAACMIVGGSIWFSICIGMKFTLKMLLSYQGNMFEGRGRKVSLKTKIWGLLLKAIHAWNPPHLYSFQNSLPSLPVPKIKDTVQRHLRSIQPTLDDEDYKIVENEAKEFLNGIGKKLQRYLVLKSWWKKNYVSDWWGEYIYLRGRGPLMGYSNIYSGDNVALPTTDQATRAASYASLILQFREKIDNQTLTPIVLQNIVPLCSWQNEKLFNTTRIPGIECDKLFHLDESNHIAVLHKGSYYKVIIRHKGRLLNAREIQFQLECILAEKPQPSESEKNLASLTAWNRTKWAEVREKFFKSGGNKISLDAIESAAFMLVLHDGPYEFDYLDRKKRDLLHSYAKQCLTGEVNGFWFDKSFSLAVGTNGRFIMNAEHSPMDGTVMGRMMEEVMFDDILSYDENGNLLAKMEKIPPKPIRLKFDLNDEELKEKINEAYKDGLKLFDNIDHRIMMFENYGKGFMKTCNLSPDAFIQMALQLAYFRDFGRFSLTYEASMTRLYIQGRTETVRSCTIESSAWVRSMEDEKSSTAERVKLLQEACKQHQKGYLEAMTGKGIDRHLFCLYVVSKYLEVESPFLKRIFSEPWKLSTSQTPHGQTPKINLKKYPELNSFVGGFGPIADNSYSVSYIVSSEDIIYFHLSSMKSCPTTDTLRFENQIRKSLCDIRDLMNDYKKNK